MPGRKFSSASEYRYGFNGKENVNEVYGEGNAYDFGARILDPKLGRWMSVDPLAKKYPNESPFIFGGNNTILFKDIDGRDRIVTITVVGPNNTQFQVRRTYPDEYKYEKHANERAGYDFYKQDIIVNVTIKLPSVGTSYQEAMKSPDNVIQKYIFYGPLVESNAAEYMLGAKSPVYKFFNNLMGDESHKVQKDGWRPYGNGTDREWEKGLPSAGKGTNSFDLSKLITTLGMVNGVEKPVDLIEQIQFDGLFVLMKVIEQQTKKVGNLVTSTEETLKEAKPAPVKVYGNGASEDNRTDYPNSVKNSSSPLKPDTVYYNQPKTTTKGRKNK